MNSKSFYPFSEFGARTQQAVLPIGVMSEGKWIPLGTGFMISSDGLMMTAAHVIKEAARYAGRELKDSGQYEDVVNLGVLYVTNEPLDNGTDYLFGGYMPIRRSWWNGSLDIALCWVPCLESVVDGSKKTFPIVTLSFAPPPPGEQVLGIGYYKMAGSAVLETEKGPEFSHFQETAMTRGTVVEVFLTRRDPGMLSFPCFRTDARFDPRMSGGPIFRQNGTVCGMVCSSMGAITEDSEHVSYASLLWPSVAISLAVCFEPAILEQVTLMDLIRRGLVACDDSAAAIFLETDELGQRTVNIRMLAASTVDQTKTPPAQSSPTPWRFRSTHESA